MKSMASRSILTFILSFVTLFVTALLWYAPWSFFDPWFNSLGGNLPELMKARDYEANFPLILIGNSLRILVLMYLFYFYTKRMSLTDPRCFLKFSVALGLFHMATLMPEVAFGTYGWPHLLVEGGYSLITVASVGKLVHLIMLKDLLPSQKGEQA